MRSRFFLRVVVKALVVSVLATGVWALDTSRVASVEPATAKVGANVTLQGEGLGKKAVVAVFLSTTNEDFAATVVEQTNEKIVIKVPKVKPGDYSISIQVEKVIFIQPIHLMIEE